MAFKIVIIYLLLLGDIFGNGFKLYEMDRHGLRADRNCVVIHLGPAREDYLVDVDKNGRFKYKNNNQPLKGPGKYVMDPNGKIYYLSDLDIKVLMERHPKKDGESARFYHSSFLDGGPVAAAGTLEFDSTSSLLKVTNDSGHYKPDQKSLEQFSQVVKGMGVKNKFKEENIVQNTSFSPPPRPSNLPVIGCKAVLFKR